MIITGYQGIGKSTLAKEFFNVIDLESTNFWNYENPIHKTGTKTRPEDWYIYYCQIAEDLSRQGYTVFVSCHPQVRKWLSENGQEKFCAIFPCLSIKQQWLDKLYDRYTSSHLEKDLRAYEHAKSVYDNDIAVLLDEAEEGYFNSVSIIEDLSYSLYDIVDNLRNSQKIAPSL